MFSRIQILCFKKYFSKINSGKYFSLHSKQYFLGPILKKHPSYEFEIKSQKHFLYF